MKKEQKLNLNDLKIESFVTSLEEKDAQTVKGGSEWSMALASVVVVAASLCGGSLLACEVILGLLPEKETSSKETVAKDSNKVENK